MTATQAIGAAVMTDLPPPAEAFAQQREPSAGTPAPKSLAEQPVAELVRVQPAASEAFTAVVEQHAAAIRRLVVRLLGWRDGSSGDDDVVQDVFLAAWSAWGRFQADRDPELWLRRIAVNECRSRLRREAVRRRWLGWLIGDPPRESSDDENKIETEERAVRARRAIAELPPTYREVTVLHYLEQLTLERIAAVTGSRKNTIEVRLHRARKQLEESLADLVE